ncbi:MAG: mediator complex subunit [Phylliscum demangeonii]|nr:MAG: mediator complex subunit [Phylliscum demangeonii]
MSLEEQEWIHFLHRSLLSRLSAAKFEAFAQLLFEKSPLPGTQLAAVFLKPHANAHQSLAIDPLLPVYIDVLVRAGLVPVSHLLAVLLRFSALRPAQLSLDGSSSSSEAEADRKSCTSLDLDEWLLLALARSFSAGPLPKKSVDVFPVLRALALWLAAIVAASSADEMMPDIALSLPTAYTAVTEAVGMLLVAVMENPRCAALLCQPLPKDLERSLAHALHVFVPLVSRTSLQVGHRLQALQRLHGLLEESEVKALETMMDGGSMPLDALVDLHDGPTFNTRAAPYIFLNALLVGRPLMDDRLTLHHLYARHKGNVSSLCTDLVVAAFDVLSNAAFRNEAKQTLFLLRSFLINKIPLLLVEAFAAMYAPLTAEFCIAQALTHVDPQAFPSFSSIFDVSAGSSVLSEVRQEFLFACCLHGLLPESSIEPLLGEIPMQELPPGGKYSKDSLFAQCVDDPGRIDSLLGEMEGLEGNAGAVVLAIVDVIGHLCATRDTASLKSVCVSLAQRPSSLDVMLLFSTPAAILQSICELLDSWRYDDDQGEYQPVYEEFGCILLLVLAFVHRYDLTAADVGIAGREPFVARLLTQGHQSQRLEQLSEAGRQQLGGWIRGLFEADNGISDELMSLCPPQDFYMLVPTLLQQSILACTADVMSRDTLKGGLEYMLETFLLPSLVGAITWLTHQLWEVGPGDDGGGGEMVLQILQSVITPRSISGEAEQVHGVVMGMVGGAVSAALAELRRRDAPPRGADVVVDALQQALTTTTTTTTSGRLRTVASAPQELDQWVAGHTGGLCGALRHTFQSLVLWSTAPAINMTPTSYSHRQLLVAVQLQGARAVVRTLVDELRLQTQNGSAALALDIAAAFVCAPTALDLSTVGTRATRLTLREALQLEVDRIPRPAAGAAALLRPTITISHPHHPHHHHHHHPHHPAEPDPDTDAATVARLHRRVEAHFASVAAAAAASDAAAHAHAHHHDDPLTADDAAAMAADHHLLVVDDHDHHHHHLALLPPMDDTIAASLTAGLTGMTTTTTATVMPMPIPTAPTTSADVDDLLMAAAAAAVADHHHHLTAATTAVSIDAGIDDDLAAAFLDDL